MERLAHIELTSKLHVLSFLSFYHIRPIREGLWTLRYEPDTVYCVRCGCLIPCEYPSEGICNSCQNFWQVVTDRQEQEVCFKFHQSPYRRRDRGLDSYISRSVVCVDLRRWLGLSLEEARWLRIRRDEDPTDSGTYCRFSKTYGLTADENSGWLDPQIFRKSWYVSKKKAYWLMITDAELRDIDSDSASSKSSNASVYSSTVESLSAINETLVQWHRDRLRMYADLPHMDRFLTYATRAVGIEDEEEVAVGMLSETGKRLRKTKESADEIIGRLELRMFEFVLTLCREIVEEWLNAEHHDDVAELTDQIILIMRTHLYDIRSGASMRVIESLYQCLKRIESTEPTVEEAESSDEDVMVGSILKMSRVELLSHRHDHSEEESVGPTRPPSDANSVMSSGSDLNSARLRLARDPAATAYTLIRMLFAKGPRIQMLVEEMIKRL